MSKEKYGGPEVHKHTFESGFDIFLHQLHLIKNGVHGIIYSHLVWSLTIVYTHKEPCVISEHGNHSLHRAVQ